MEINDVIKEFDEAYMKETIKKSYLEFANKLKIDKNLINKFEKF